MRRNADFWISLVLLAFCAFAADLTSELSTRGTGTAAGPSFFPWLMIGGMAVLSAALLIRSLRRAHTREGATRPPFSMLAKLGVFVLMMLAYAAFYVPAGYLVSTIVFFVIAMLVLGERRLLHLIVIPSGIVASVYLVFTQIIKVYLP